MSPRCSWHPGRSSRRLRYERTRRTSWDRRRSRARSGRPSWSSKSRGNRVTGDHCRPSADVLTTRSYRRLRSGQQRWQRWRVRPHRSPRLDRYRRTRSRMVRWKLRSRARNAARTGPGSSAPRSRTGARGGEDDEHQGERRREPAHRRTPLRSVDSPEDRREAPQRFHAFLCPRTRRHWLGSCETSRDDEDPVDRPEVQRGFALGRATSYASAGSMSKNAVQSAALLAPLPRMNCSTISRAASSLNCTGGDFMK